VITRLLLASLNMDAILAEATIHQKRQALGRAAQGFGLQDAYHATLDRIRQQGGSKARLGMEALMWISRSERPLESQELCHALGVELGEEGFTIQNVPSIQTVLGFTLGLVTFEEETSTPRLLHFTLQEYLEQHPTLFATADSTMAEICLTYLNCQLVRALPPDSLEALEIAPFLEYATCFWGTHAARGVTEQAKLLALRLLDRYEDHISSAVFGRNMQAKSYWGRAWGWRYLRGVRGISGLHCIAFWGIAEIAIAMLGMKIWQANRPDSRGWTPLMWALTHNNHGIVELFLGQDDIEPNTAIGGGRTIFSFAAELGNEDALKLLLARWDVDPNLPDRNGRTPLSLAAERGYEDVTELLLKRGDVDPNSTDSYGRTPLFYAATWKAEGVVKLLLQRADVDPNLSGNDGRTPLVSASGERSTEIVKLLLERRDVNPNLPDRDGRTPLSFAAVCGAESVARLLLGHRDVNPDSPDGNGRTPLLHAATWGAWDVVKALLERADVNPNSADRDGRTPLSSAAAWGAESVVKLLLERRDVDPNSPDRDGRTPLSFATEWGQEHIVKLFLERGDVNLASLDIYGRRPLSYAITNKREGVVRLLWGLQNHHLPIIRSPGSSSNLATTNNTITFHLRDMQ